MSRESNRQELSALNMKSEGTGRGGDNLIRLSLIVL